MTFASGHFSMNVQTARHDGRQRNKFATRKGKKRDVTLSSGFVLVSMADKEKWRPEGRETSGNKQYDKRQPGSLRSGFLK